MALSTLTLDRLQSQLLTSGLQQRNSALYQVIDELIKYIRTLNQATFGISTGGGSGGGGIANDTFITVANETATLPNSRQLVAGDNITLDISNPGQIIISASLTQDVIEKILGQLVTIRVAELDLPYNKRNGKVTVGGSFTSEQVGAPVFISQVPDKNSDAGFMQFIGEVIDTNKLRVFWYAPLGAPRQVKINYLIGA